MLERDREKKERERERELQDIAAGSYRSRGPERIVLERERAEGHSSRKL